MSVTIEPLTYPTSLEVKRCYLPFMLKTQCPNCGAAIEHDISEHYLTRPLLNQPFDCDLHHECSDDGEYVDHEWSVCLSLNVALEHVAT